MRVIAKSTLRAFWTKPGRHDAEQPILTWYREAERADWSSPADIKRQHGSASILENGRVVFNIAGNKCRLVAAIRYDLKIIFVRFVGMHTEYDPVDAQEI
ncbi:MAG TPA: type II toxin-antitoxin system HigB family toxin [Polyangiaceae bacterium]